MQNPFQLTFPDGQTAQAMRPQRWADLPGMLTCLGLTSSRPTLVVVGGAGELREAESERLRPFFVALARQAQVQNAVVVDGGTDFGVMQFMGQARAAMGATFPLVGVVPNGLAAIPDNSSDSDTVPLEPNHTHFALIPGSQWGDESPWIARVASELAGDRQSVTVMVNGGEITWKDVTKSVLAGRPVIILAGSGRAADTLAAAVREPSTTVRAAELVASGLLHVLDIAQGAAALADRVGELLTAKE